MELVEETHSKYVFKLEKNEKCPFKLVEPTPEGIFEVSKKIIHYTPKGEIDRVSGVRGPVVRHLMPIKE